MHNVVGRDPATDVSVASPIAEDESPRKHSAKADKKKHRLRIVHKTRGRVRMKVAAFKGDAEKLQEIGDKFAALPGVESVEINSTTGSIVLNYQHHRHDEFHSHFERHCEEHHCCAPPPTDFDKLATNIEKEAAYLAEHSHSAKAIVHVCKRLDRQIKRNTNNTLDLKIGLAAGVIGLTLFEVGASAATPVWLTLGVFTLNHFVEMQHRHALEEKMKKDRTQDPADDGKA